MKRKTRLPLVYICCSVVWFQFNTLVVHFISFPKLLLISQSLKEQLLVSKRLRDQHQSEKQSVNFPL